MAVSERAPHGGVRARRDADNHELRPSRRYPLFGAWEPGHGASRRDHGSVTISAVRVFAELH